MGLDPDPLTLRRLWTMLEAHERAAWDKAAQVCAVVANAAPHFGKGQRKRYTLFDFHPYYQRQKRGMSIGESAELLGPAMAERKRKRE